MCVFVGRSHRRCITLNISVLLIDKDWDVPCHTSYKLVINQTVDNCPVTFTCDYIKYSQLNLIRFILLGCYFQDYAPVFCYHNSLSLPTHNLSPTCDQSSVNTNAWLAWHRNYRSFHSVALVLTAMQLVFD